MFFIINDVNGNLVEMTEKSIRAFNYIKRNPSLSVKMLSFDGEIVSNYPFGTDFIVDVETGKIN